MAFSFSGTAVDGLEASLFHPQDTLQRNVRVLHHLRNILTNPQNTNINFAFSNAFTKLINFIVKLMMIIIKKTLELFTVSHCSACYLEATERSPQLIHGLMLRRVRVGEVSVAQRSSMLRITSFLKMGNDGNVRHIVQRRC